SRRRHTRSKRDWSSDVCSSDLERAVRMLAASDERSFYGLLLSKNEETLFVTTDELLRLIEQWEHPMVRIEMNDAKTAQYVEQLQIGRASCRERGEGQEVTGE